MKKFIAVFSALILALVFILLVKKCFNQQVNIPNMQACEDVEYCKTIQGIDTGFEYGYRMPNITLISNDNQEIKLYDLLNGKEYLIINTCVNKETKECVDIYNEANDYINDHQLEENYIFLVDDKEMGNTDNIYTLKNGNFKDFLEKYTTNVNYILDQHALIQLQSSNEEFIKINKYIKNK